MQVFRGIKSRHLVGEVDIHVFRLNANSQCLNKPAVKHLVHFVNHLLQLFECHDVAICLPKGIVGRGYQLAEVDCVGLVFQYVVIRSPFCEYRVACDDGTVLVMLIEFGVG